MRPDGPRDPVAGPDGGPEAPFPLRLSGKVVKGFGRGSKELGIPTANIPLEGLSVGGHDEIESGIYYGWAGLSSSKATRRHDSEDKYQHMTVEVSEKVNAVLYGGDRKAAGERDSSANDKGAIYPMVMSIGWNPYYKNTVRSIEIHIMHHFETDFYDSHMNVSILGFIRPEYDYVSKESLIEDIKTDINVAGESLARMAYAKYKDEPFLLEFKDKTDVASWKHGEDDSKFRLLYSRNAKAMFNLSQWWQCLVSSLCVCTLRHRLRAWHTRPPCVLHTLRHA